MNEVLLSYFEYLRDTSKNLAASGDLCRCLVPRFSKQLKNTVCEVSSSFAEGGIVHKDDVEGKSFISYLSQIKKEVNRQVYLGVGYIVGSFNKRVFGSIVNIPVYFEEEDFIGGKVKFELCFEEMSLNYDLISSLLPDYFISELDGTAQDILSVLANFEIELQSINSLDVLESKVDAFINDLLATNKNIILVPLKDNISHADLCDNQNKNALINKKDWFYRVDKYHFFIADVPDAISTWKNLNSFCEEIKNNDFKSNVLREFFSNIFGLDFAHKRVSDFIDYSDTINQYLPISLSKNQRIAINNCFNSNISYVQGPPGTGKSHTISGILLASFLLGKKVLVVAQKNNALDVVKNKIKDFYDESLSVPFIYFNKEDKLELKTNLITMCNQDLPEKPVVDLLETNIRKTEGKLKETLINLDKKLKMLSYSLTAYSDFYQSNEEFMHHKDIVFNSPIYNADIKGNLYPTKTENENYLYKVKNIENKFYEFECLTKLDLIQLNKLEKQFNKHFKVKNEIKFIELIKNRICYSFLKEWFDLTWRLGKTESLNNKLTAVQFIESIKYDINVLKKELKLVQETLYKQYHKKKLYASLLDDKMNSEIQRFGKMLHWTRGDKVAEKMEQINYDHLLSAYPIWLSEIKNIGEILPNKAEMFDLVIVDEASQVNLAEILPVFYRAKHICIVGDHKQLGLNAAGLSFSLSKKFDKIVWNKYKPGNIDFEEANYRNLTITKASILDLLRSEENKETFKYVMLDEHYRSLPGLSSFNNKEFYGNELKIMTEVPDKSLVSCFAAIKVAGSKDNKINKTEAEEVINVIKYLTNKDLSDEKKNDYKSKIKLNDFVPILPTIGIISAVRDQVEYIKELLEEFSEEDFENHRLICGTPEEFQGDECDIVIISTTTDDDSRNNGHYSNENRFNVATSRSRFYTVFIYSNVNKIPMYDKYLQHFGLSGRKAIATDNVLGWDYNKNNNSEFNGLLADLLLKINGEIEKEHKIKIKLFNQVKSCGQKPLSFVLYNEQNKRYVGIDPLGVFDNNQTITYSDQYVGKYEVLSKAGWNVIDTPYNIWYEYGKLDLNNFRYGKEVERLKAEIIKHLKDNE